jgi:hypothetical protein
MEKVALFDRKNSDPERGRHFFTQDDDEDLGRIGNSFFRLVLECLWVWAKWFPIDPDTNRMSLYKIAVQRLIKQSRICSLIERSHL